MTSSRQLMVVVLLVASVVMFFLGPSLSARLRRATAFALVPFGDIGMGLTTAICGRLGGLDLGEGQRLSPSALRRIIEENIVLRGKVDSLAQKYEDLKARRDELDDLYDRWDGFECALIPARVVGRQSVPYGSSRLINVGRTSGVDAPVPVTTLPLLTDRSKAIAPGLAAVTASALVGRIVSSGAFCARLQLVTDRDFRIHAKIRRLVDPDAPRQVMISSGGKTTLEPLTDGNNLLIDVQARGDGAGGLIVADVSADHKVRAGDWLVTRSEDVLLPIQVRIGRVTDVQTDRSNPHFVKLTVRPHVDFDSLRDVYVVVPLAARAKAIR